MLLSGARAMPTYDYECSGCGRRFEVFEKMGAGGVKTCPGCHRRKARRLIGAGAGFIFKGSGFYTTDSRRSSVSGGDSKESKESKPEGSPPAKKTNESKDSKGSKPEASPPAKKTSRFKKETKE